MRELILDLALREADAGDELLRDVDQSTNLDFNLLALLVVLELRLLQLLSISADEQRRHVVAVRELPGCVGLLLAEHRLEIIDHLLRLTGLLESVREQCTELTIVLRVALTVDAQEGGELALVLLGTSLGSLRRGCGTNHLIRRVVSVDHSSHTSSCLAIVAFLPFLCRTLPFLWLLIVAFLPLGCRPFSFFWLLGVFARRCRHFCLLSELLHYVLFLRGEVNELHQVSRAFLQLLHESLIGRPVRFLANASKPVQHVVELCDQRRRKVEVLNAHLHSEKPIDLALLHKCFIEGQALVHLDEHRLHVNHLVGIFIR